MKLEMDRQRMLIIPENDLDEIYLEEVLKLKLEGDRVYAIRISCMENQWGAVFLKRVTNKQLKEIYEKTNNSN